MIKKKEYYKDLIGENGNYESSNCRLATRKEQMNNTNHNVICLLDGSEYGLPELSRKFNIPVRNLAQRFRGGWSVEKAVSNPVKK